MSSSAFEAWGARGLLLAAVALNTGCEIAPSEYVFGFNVTGQRFELYSEEIGVHPSQDALLDPNNPFKDYGVGSETKWEILADGGNVATFYAWATLLASQPTGEHQFYTGIALRGIYLTEEAPEEDLETIRTMAIAAFQSVLDNFPESVTFEASGKRSFRLATFAFNQIIELGGQVQGDWVLVQLPNGGTEAVRSASIDPPRAEEGGS
jgi:hypothetical protein